MRIAEALLEHEVLDAPQLKQLIAGEPLAVEDRRPWPRSRRRAASRARAEEGRPAGILPPPVPDPRPTS